MHLAIVSPYPPAITGIGQYGYHVSRGLAQAGLFSRISILTGSAGQDAIKPIRVIKAWNPNGLDSGLRIRRHLLDLSPDLVWFNLGASVFGRSPLANLSGFLGPTFSRQAGIPTVVTLHELVAAADLRALRAPGGPLAAYGARLLTHIAKQADVLCVTMQRYVDWLSRRDPRLNCVAIPIGLYHTPEMLPPVEKQELLFFTTLAPFKGLEVLLEAFQELKVHYPALHLTIAGTTHARFPDYTCSLRARYERLAGVDWLGEVPEERVRELYQRAQIVVVPYSASTGSSSTMYQAAGWGRPVVASDLPDNMAIATESDLQFAFFKRASAPSLAMALRAQLESRDLRSRMVAHNFASIQRSRPENTAQAYLRAFNQALEACASPKRIAPLPEIL